MKKITIEIDDKFAAILSITAIGTINAATNVSTHALDLNKVSSVKIKADGNAEMIFTQ